MARIRSVINNWATECALPGCTKRVAYHKKSVKPDGTPTAKFKTFCNYHRDNIFGRAAKEAFLRSRGCENRDGHLGWVCTCTDQDPLTIDHINGDRNNNDISNIKVLCHNSHNRKTFMNGDHLNRYSHTNDNFHNFFTITKL